MLEIIKYQFLDRRHGFIVTAAIMAGLNLVSIAMLLLNVFNPASSLGGGYGFWVFFGIASSFIIPMISFFSCGNGHIYEILYRNTNYLILSIPRRGSEILGGRMIAGLAEFLAFLIGGVVFFFINAMLLTAISFKSSMGTAESIRFFLEKTLLQNGLSMLNMGALLVFYFILIGTIISFVTVIASMIFKKRGLAVVVSCIGSIWVFGKISDLGEYLSKQFNLLAPLSFDVSGFNVVSSGMNMSYSNAQTVNMGVPLVTLALFLCVATFLFTMTAQLIEKRVEL